MIDRDALDKVIAHAGEVARNDRSKWNRTYKLFEDRLGAQGVIGKLLTQEKQLGNRIVKEMSEVNPRYVILSIVTGGDEEVRLSKVRETLAKAKLPAARCALIVEYDEGDHTVTPVELQVFQQPDTISDELGDVYELIPVSVTRPESTPEVGPGTATGGVEGPTRPIALVPMIVDDRVRRAIRISISTTSAVLLVGPPGTGKTALLMEVIDEIRTDPASFGFGSPLGEPIIVTPEESWTAREIVGGMTVAEDDSLRFREGYLLRAIREDRWLVLDEANRADLDKIFGVMLTWLSDQEVDLGPVSTAPSASSVCLGWSPDAASQVEIDPQDSVDGDAEEVEVPIRYLAGHDWRLLGTYNALDAQRVFRFGQALGRRFLRVPVPPIEPYLFTEAAEPFLVKLNADARSAVTDLYAAHFEREETQLGPALFMRIPDYVIAGLDTMASGSQEDGEDPVVMAAYVNELVSEAYLVNVGAFLARYDEDSLERLGERIVGSAALSESEWKWVLNLSRHLG